MKKTISLLLLFLLVLPLLAACGEEAPSDIPDGMARAKNDAMDLWVFYPETWSVAENADVLKLTSAEQNSLEGQMTAGDVTDGAAVLPSNIANVTVVALEETAEDPEAFLDAWKRGFADTFVFDETVEKKKLGADETRSFTYRLVGSGEDALYFFRQTLVFHRGQIYAVTFSATPELYELLLSSAETIVNSLTFEKVSAEENSPLSDPADATVKGEALPEKDGLVALTNAGVDFVLYYPEKGWTPTADTGFLAVRAEDGATVSVVRGDAYAASIQTPEQYLEEQYYPSFDALYGAHKELSREAELRAEDYCLTVSYESEIGGETYVFFQAIYLRQGYLYTLLYTAKSADYEAHLAEVQKMADAFSCTKDSAK